MTTKRTSLQLFLFLLPMLFIGAFWAGCSGSSDHEGPVGTARMEEGNVDADGNFEEEGKQAGPAVQASANRADDNDDTMGSSAKKDDEISDTERDRAVNEVRELRDDLAKELEEVRQRLRDGSNQGQDRQDDQRRAAELGQTLASLEMKAQRIESATEEEWAKIREEARKEVEEVRARLDKKEKERS
jgi:ElaB/YqjD/DUF883 family membrane-anchored ribosome-binding protein